MKNKIKILVILLIVFLLPGCVKYNFEMKIGKDKSVSIQIISAVEEGQEEDSYIEDDRRAAQDKGFIVTKYEDDNYVGYKFTKKYYNIDDISTENEIKVELRDLLKENKPEPKYYFQKKESLFKTTYIANFTIDTYDSYSSYIDSLEYKIILPSKAKDSNADKISSDGKILEWNLKSDKTNKVYFEYEEKSDIVTILAGVSIGIIITSLIFLKINENKNKKNYNNQNINQNNMYNNTNNYPQNYLQQNNNFNSTNNIGKMDASEVSIKENYVNNMLPIQNTMYTNMNNNINNNMLFPTGIVDMAHINNSQNNWYPINSYNDNNNQNTSNNTYDNQNSSYNNSTEDDTPSIDKPNLNSNINNNIEEEKRYELSSNKDIYI